MFTPTVKVYIDPESGEPTGRYPPSFGFKVKKKEAARFNVVVYTEDKFTKSILMTRMEMIYMEFNKCLKNSQVKGLFKCDFVWHSPGKFGCTWSAQQLRVKIPKGFDEVCFHG